MHRHAERSSEGTLNIRARLRRSLNRVIKSSSLSRHQIAGEMSLFGATTRSATLQARSETCACVLDYGAFQELLAITQRLPRPCCRP